MNRIFFLLSVYCSIPFFLSAQYDTQTNILTEEGIITVSKTDTGDDMIQLNAGLWNEMVKGTKFVSQNLHVAKKVFIQLTNKNRHCRSGIGFSCGIFDCNIRTAPKVVDNRNRICQVMIQLQDKHTVRIIFLDKVDWQSLQNE